MSMDESIEMPIKPITTTTRNRDVYAVSDVIFNSFRLPYKYYQNTQ